MIKCEVNRAIFFSLYITNTISYLGFFFCKPRRNQKSSEIFGPYILKRNHEKNNTKAVHASLANVTEFEEFTINLRLLSFLIHQ